MSNAVEATKRLAAACDAAYEAHKASCSHAVTAVIQAIHDPEYEHRAANELIDWLSNHWREVSLDDGFSAANQGAVVIGGKKEPGHGHVIAIYPGNKIFNGGYQYFWKKGNKHLTMPQKAAFPRCLSTSLGGWPGALSCGDKTVWDPWANDESFALVRFWTPRWPLT